MLEKVQAQERSRYLMVFDPYLIIVGFVICWFVNSIWIKKGKILMIMMLWRRSAVTVINRW